MLHWSEMLQVIDYLPCFIDLWFYCSLFTVTMPQFTDYRDTPLTCVSDHVSMVHWLPRHGSLISTTHFWSPQRSLWKYTNAYNKLYSTLNTKQNDSSTCLAIWLYKRNEKCDSITVTSPSLFSDRTLSLWCNSPRHLLVLPPSAPTHPDCSSTIGALFWWKHHSLAASLTHLHCFWLKLL